MYTDALKERIGSLPPDDYINTWRCIEALDAALSRAGRVGELALTYVRVRHEERLAVLLGAQEVRIAHLKQVNGQQAQHHRDELANLTAEFKRKQKLARRRRRNKR